MKPKSFILSLAFVAFLTSSIPYGSHNLAIGSEAPSLTLSAHSTSNLDNLKGKQVLINFWSASDASSRIANRLISQLASTGNYQDTEFVSVCIDTDNTIATEISKIDRISDKVITLNKSDITPDVFEDFQTGSGCRSFLIDSFGNLKGIASSPEMISGLLS